MEETRAGPARDDDDGGDGGDGRWWWEEKVVEKEVEIHEKGGRGDEGGRRRRRRRAETKTKVQTQIQKEIDDDFNDDDDDDNINDDDKGSEASTTHPHASRVIKHRFLALAARRRRYVYIRERETRLTSHLTPRHAMTTLCRAYIRPVRLAPRARVRASAYAAPPMSAFVDAESVKAALALSCVDPSLSVLVYGGRGSGKSTLCRSVASVVPEKKFITVPLGVTDERVLGSVDVEASAKTGRATYEPGVLASANDGVLFIDDVNLVGTSI